MISVLEQIANGNIDLNQEAIKKDFNEHHHKDVVKVMISCRENLMNVLDGRGKELFEKFLELQEEAIYFDNVDRFIYGYKVGIRMMVEVLR